MSDNPTSPPANPALEAEYGSVDAARIQVLQRQIRDCELEIEKITAKPRFVKEG